MPTNATRIVLCYPVEGGHLDQIRATLDDLGVAGEVVDAGQEGVAEELLNADIYCGHAKVPVPWSDIVAAGRLRWIQSSAAGMDHCLVPEVIDSDITVSSASGVLADQVADHTLALTLAALRSLPVFFRAQQAREFIRRPTRDLCGATVGIVGLGGNGRRLVEVLRPFRTRIVATDWFPEHPPEGVELLGADRLDELLEVAEILILTAPLNAKTRGMIGAAELARLPKDALVVNVARGPLLVEKDLVAAIESGHLSGAALDVTEIEPLPPTSKLWDLPGVVITPHVGGQAARRIDEMTEFFCANLRRWFAGEPLSNLLAEKHLGFPLPEHAAWRSG